MRQFLLFTLFSSIIIASTTALAESSVWVISKGSQKIYIGGTIHVLSQHDYPLPKEFEQVYKASDKLVFETNITEASGLEFQMQMMKAMTYSEGKTLRSELSPSTYTALEKYCASKNIQLALMEPLKPQMAILALLGAELQRMGMVATGVDETFHKRARQDNKPTQYLETTSAQLDLLVNMGKGNEDQLVLNTLRDLDNIDTTMDAMKDAWRSGDQTKFERIALTPMKKDFPNLYQNLLVTRNNTWLSHIENMLSTPETELVLVGALHMIGKDGVLQQLQSRGYTIKQF